MLLGDARRRCQYSLSGMLMLDGDFQRLTLPRSTEGVFSFRDSLIGVAVLLSVDPHSHSHWTLDNGSLSHVTRDLLRVLFGPFGLSPTLRDFFNRCIIDCQQSLIAEVVSTDALLTSNSH